MLFNALHDIGHNLEKTYITTDKTIIDLFLDKKNNDLYHALQKPFIKTLETPQAIYHFYSKNFLGKENPDITSIESLLKIEKSTNTYKIQKIKGHINLKLNKFRGREDLVLKFLKKYCLFLIDSTRFEDYQSLIHKIFLEIFKKQEFFEILAHPEHKYFSINFFAIDFNDNHININHLNKNHKILSKNYNLENLEKDISVKTLIKKVFLYKKEKETCVFFKNKTFYDFNKSLFYEDLKYHDMMHFEKIPYKKEFYRIQSL